MITLKNKIFPNKLILNDNLLNWLVKIIRFILKFIVNKY